MAISIPTLRAYARDTALVGYALSGITFAICLVYSFSQPAAQVWPYVWMSALIVFMCLLTPLLAISWVLDKLADFIGRHQ
jgi:hypothetical protein